MFNRKKSPEQIELEELITDAKQHMIGIDVDTEEYTRARENLEGLHKMLSEYRSVRVDPNTVIATTGSVLSVGIIVGYERLHVFSSAARNFVRQVR